MRRAVTRRQFLKLAGAASLALAHTHRADAAAASLAFSPAAFDATQDSVLIWARGDGGARIRVDFGEEGASQLTAGPVADLTSDTDYCATIPLTHLAPGKRWSYHIMDAASGKPLSEPCRFKTAPSSAAPFTFAFSADMEDSYQPFKLFDVIDSKQPDFLLLLGDLIYADHPKKSFIPSVAYYRIKHAANRKDRHLQNFLSRYATYAIWDDHETENNANSLNPNMGKALQVYKEYWPCKAVDANALYRQFAWAGVDFFILDTRRFRSRQKMPEGPEKTMLGAAQKNWFKENLKSSKAPFKFVVTSVPFQGGGADSWGSYKTERDEIARFIRSEKIGGVIFLTGAYHLARDWSNAKTGLREFMAGPIASFTHYKKNPDARARYEKAGTFHYGDGYNFGLWRVDSAAGKARLDFIGAAGQTLFQTEVTA
ncbi:MAG TPA: alkaline phosphatase D family protein [Candidatus Binatia bacterium]|jgi:alkaline phosphatase D